MISHRPTLERLLSQASGKRLSDVPEMGEEGWAGLSRFAYLLARELGARPIRMVLHCPSCGTQHVDAPKPPEWSDPPHKSHLCADCGHVWRPCDQETTGVAVTIRVIPTSDRRSPPPT